MVHQFIPILCCSLIFVATLTSSRSLLFAGAKVHHRNRKIASSLSTMEESKVGEVPKDEIPELAKDFSSCMATSHAISGAWAWLEKGVKYGNVELDQVRLMLTRSFRDIDKEKWRKFAQCYTYTMPPGKPQEGSWQEGTPFPLELTGALKFAPSPSGEKLVAFKDDGKGDKKEHVVELYNKNVLTRKYQLGELHESPNFDGWFGTLAWSKDEKYVAYVAEKKKPKTKSWFDKADKPPGKGEDAAKEAKKSAAAEDAARDFGSAGMLGGRGDKFLYREDWGEKYVGCVGTALFVLNLETGKVAEVKGCPSDSTLGTPTFSPCGNKLVFGAWSNAPNKLGMIYCFQRPCKLFCQDITKLKEGIDKDPEATQEAEEAAEKKSGDGGGEEKKAGEEGEEEEEETPDAVCLTPNAALARTPRFSNKGDRLAYFTSEKGFPTHNGAFQLVVMDWADWAGAAEGGSPPPSSRVVVDVVDDPAPAAFPGLWTMSMPSRPWAPDDSALFLNSGWRSAMAMLRVDAASGEVTRLSSATSILEGEGHGTGDLSEASAAMMGLGDYGMLFTASCPNNPGGLGLLLPTDSSAPYLSSFEVIKGPEGCGSLQFPYVAQCQPKAPSASAELAEKIRGISWKIVKVQTPGGGPEIEAILWLPSPLSTQKWKKPEDEEGATVLPPLIVSPHGGPHSCSMTMFIPAYAYYVASQGYALLLPNYRGSTGFGRLALESLPGRCGTQDIQDCVLCTKAVLEAEGPPVVDKDRVVMVGGSHGGFLTGHGIGQYPDLFKVGVLRNPVCNIASMCSVSDIRDWCFVEALGGDGYDFSAYQRPEPGDLERMWASSPIAHADKVVAPMLMCLGGVDRRVPPSQGLEYYHYLKARGIETRMLWYPEDCHAIDKVGSDADEWVNVMQWLNKYV